MSTIMNIVQDERLKGVLESHGGGYPVDVQRSVGLWWKLVQNETDVAKEEQECLQRLAAIRERRLKILGGREVAEQMIVEALDANATKAPAEDPPVDRPPFLSLVPPLDRTVEIGPEPGNA